MLPDFVEILTAKPPRYAGLLEGFDDMGALYFDREVESSYLDDETVFNNPTWLLMKPVLMGLRPMLLGSRPLFLGYSRSSTGLGHAVILVERGGELYGMAAGHTHEGHIDTALKLQRLSDYHVMSLAVGGAGSTKWSNELDLAIADYLEM